MKPTLAWLLPLLIVSCFPDPGKDGDEDEQDEDLIDSQDDDEGDDDDEEDDDGGGAGDDGGGSGGGSGSGSGSGSGGDSGSGSGSGGGDGSGSGDDGGGGTTEFDPCPTDVVCVDQFPYTDDTTTVGAPFDDFDRYSCAPSTDESGREVVYRVDLSDDGFLAVDLPQSRMESGADIDVHVLATLDSDDCIDRGHWRSGAFLEAGSYYVVADTWVSSSGDEKDGEFRITLGFTSVGDMMRDGVDQTVAEDALFAFDTAWVNRETDRFAYAVTDFSLHSSNKRQWVYDLAKNSLEWELFVAHGEGSSTTSDTGAADTFSNINDSHQSSLGMMRAAETYTGMWGYSLRLDGLESRYNGLVRSRAIVVHPWEGSEAGYVSYWGETAETWGCPAIDPAVSADVIDFLADGGLLFFHYPDGDWSRNSAYLP
ncbi:MAG: murein L,D-transpeptidase catalytic domain family protein [Myxococcota bacterium]|nr:murein L,D-transpeptidase catalytic domain family protein [Myxococcota bacterium]